MAAKKVVKKIKGKSGRTVEVRATSFRRKRKDGEQGKLQKRVCVVVIGGDTPVPAFLKKRGVTTGTQMRGCYSDDAAGKKRAFAAAEKAANARKL